MMTRDKAAIDPGKYRKVAWSGRAGWSAGLVLEETIAALPAGALSRYWPMYEAGRMARLHVSPPFASWEEAFAYQFAEQENRR